MNSNVQLIAKYNDLLSAFFNELGKGSDIHQQRNELTLTILSRDVAVQNIRASQKMFRSFVTNHLKTWQVWSPDLFDVAMEVLRFNP